MAVPAYTVYANHPRLFFRDTDLSALQARTNSSSSWQTLWDNTIIPRANTLAGMSVTTLARHSQADQRLMVLAFAGWIEGSNTYKDAAIAGALQIAADADTIEPTDLRVRLMALAEVFDICYDRLSTTQKNTLATEILQQCDRATFQAFEMAGHAGDDQMVSAAGALAIAGWGSFQWQTRLATALEYWYGLLPNRGRWRMVEYQYAGGGNEKGGWYIYLGMWGELWLATFLANATNEVDPFTEFAPYFSKAWEGLLATAWRGGVDKDFEAEGDTAKTSTPRFHNNQRWAYGILSQRYPNPNSTQGGRHLRWLYDQYDTLDAVFADNKVYDVFFFDRATNTGVAPASGSPVPAKSKLFSPPGVYRYRDSWDLDASVTWRISCRSRFWLNHVHLDAGSVMVRYRDDPLLLSPAGYYDAFAGEHHVNAYQRSWLQSCAPLVMDPSQSYQYYSGAVFNDGGQHFKKFGSASTPNTPYEMLNDGSGEAWRRATIRQYQDSAAGVHLVLDLRPAYRKFHTDPDRCPILDSKFLLVHPSGNNGLSQSLLIVYVRAKKLVSTWPIYIPLHARGTWSSDSAGANVTGYRTEVATGSPGKLWLDVYQKSLHSVAISTPGTPVDGNGYGPNQFIHPAGGTNYKPSSAAGTRHQADLKKTSVYLSKMANAEEEHFVFVLAVTAAAGSKPSFSWITDANYYGITAGTETFRLHKTQDLAVLGSASPDTTAPAEVTGLALTPRNQSLRAGWADPADSDFDHVEVYYRTTAT